VQLPVMLGTNGIQIERAQETSYRYTARMRGRYLQLRIQSTQGHLGVRSIMVESFEDQRATRAMTSG
jgi:aspartyl-tRNA synthetase